MSSNCRPLFVEDRRFLDMPVYCVGSFYSLAAFVHTAGTVAPFRGSKTTNASLRLASGVDARKLTAGTLDAVHEKAGKPVFVKFLKKRPLQTLSFSLWNSHDGASCGDVEMLRIFMIFQRKSGP